MMRAIAYCASGAAHRRIPRWVSGWVVALGLGAAFPGYTQSTEAPSGSVERGKRAYMQQHCYTCHGTVGQGGERGAGPRIAPGPWPWPAFAQQTRKPRAVMPPYTDKNLSDQELADIYAYIRSIPAQRSAKDIPELSFF